MLGTDLDPYSDKKVKNKPKKGRPNGPLGLLLTSLFNVSMFLEYTEKFKLNALLFGFVATIMLTDLSLYHSFVFSLMLVHSVN